MCVTGVASHNGSAVDSTCLYYMLVQLFHRTEYSSQALLHARDFLEPHTDLVQTSELICPANMLQMACIGTFLHLEIGQQRCLPQPAMSAPAVRARRG